MIFTIVTKELTTLWMIHLTSTKLLNYDKLVEFIVRQWLNWLTVRNRRVKPLAKFN